MRICLVNPPRIQPKTWGKPSIFQPLDIAYVAALLEKQHDVKIIDAPNEGWRILEEIDGVLRRDNKTSYIINDLLLANNINKHYINNSH